MLSRLIPRRFHYHRFVLIPSKSHSHPQHHFPYSTKPPNFCTFSKYFSTNNNNGKDSSSSSVWENFRESKEKFDALFTEDSGSLAGINDTDEGSKTSASEHQWWLEEKGLDNKDEDAIFKGADKKTEDKSGGYGNHQWMGAEDLRPWSLGEERKDVFDFQDDVKTIGEFRAESGYVKNDRSEDTEKLEKEEQALTAVLRETSDWCIPSDRSLEYSFTCLRGLENLNCSISMHWCMKAREMPTIALVHSDHATETSWTFSWPASFFFGSLLLWSFRSAVVYFV